jgi:antirestriction protein ArdC
MSFDLHQRISACILVQLDTVDPNTWSPPWHGTAPVPRNALTGRRYRGLNILALWAAAQRCGYTDARWATYRQWAALGAQVGKAERGAAILFYKDQPADAEAEDTPGTPSPRFVARVSHVFNAAQVDGAPDQTGSNDVVAGPEPDVESEEVLAAFLVATGAIVVSDGSRASYSPSTDTIHLPARSAFHSASGYAATLTHELTHWTGAAHRLARDLTGRFGSRAYAVEELVAELGAAFVLGDLGLDRSPHPDHAAYCAAWLPLLRADPHALATAAAQASRASAYLADLRLAAVDGTLATPTVVPAAASAMRNPGRAA